MDRAKVDVVRWWRRRLRHGVTPAPSSCTATSVGDVDALCASAEGRAYLEEQLDTLTTGIGTAARDGKGAGRDVLVHAASTAFVLRQFDECVALLEAAQTAGAATDPPDDLDDGAELSDAGVAAWLRKARWAATVTQAQAAAAAALRAGGTVPPSLPPVAVTPVARRHVTTLSSPAFVAEFADAGVPVVVTGLFDAITGGAAWDLPYVRRVLGHHVVSVKRAVAGSAAWARLQRAATMRLSEFVDQVAAGYAPHYLHDWSLAQHAPHVLHDVTIPSYFAGDLLQTAPSGGMYREAWPSLFVGAAGSRSPLHIDAFASSFWMLLTQGRKRWTFFKPQDVHLLSPSFSTTSPCCAPQFGVDTGAVSQGSLVVGPEHPLFHTAPRYECVLEAGEVLFVPSGCPHYVENLETSVALSANFVNVSNVDAVTEELQAAGSGDARALELATHLRSLTPEQRRSTPDTHLAWPEFKQRRGAGFDAPPGASGAAAAVGADAAAGAGGGVSAGAGAGSGAAAPSHVVTTSGGAGVVLYTSNTGDTTLTLPKALEPEPGVKVAHRHLF